MPINYYTILNLTEKASAEEIRQAYTAAINKWQRLYKEQPDHLKSRIERVISYIEEAYENLCAPIEVTHNNDPLVPFGDFLLKKPTSESAPPMLTIDNAVDPEQFQSMHDSVQPDVEAGQVKELKTDFGPLQEIEDMARSVLAEIAGNYKVEPVEMPAVNIHSLEVEQEDETPEWVKAMDYAINPALLQDRQHKAPIIVAALVSLAVLVSGVIYWLFFQAVLTSNTIESAQVQTVVPSISFGETPAVDIDSEPMSVATVDLDAEQVAAAKSKQLVAAQGSTLEGVAASIAEEANINISAVSNFNTVFMGAKAFNQNIMYRFAVIDGIANSNSLLSAYMVERFIIDSNEICGVQQSNLATGVLFTLAYFNSKGELAGGYSIDDQVCHSPATARLVKKIDVRQLNAIQTQERKSLDSIVSDESVAHSVVPQ